MFISFCKTSFILLLILYYIFIYEFKYNLIEIRILFKLKRSDLTISIHSIMATLGWL